MEFKTHWKRLLSDHGHTAVGFLIGFGIAIFVSFLRGSDARVPVPRVLKMKPPAAMLVVEEPVLHPAPDEGLPEISAASSESVSSSASSESSVSPAVPVLVPVQTPPSSSSTAAVPTKKPLPSSSSASAAAESSVSSSAPSASAVSSVSSAVSSIASSSTFSEQPSDGFPPFIRTVNVVSKVPNWGAMRTPAEWNRTYDELTREDFVPLPAYRMSLLTVPMTSLTSPITDDTIPEITRKLVYSTRYFGAYDLDAGEFTADHPGVDIKLARGTPVGSIAGGRVASVSTNAALGLHVIIEHHIDGQAYYSIYGHFDSVSVSAGQTVVPGQTIGKVGMTGNTSAPHVHLQIDRGQAGDTAHVPYYPPSLPSPAEAALHVANPMVFIAAHAGGD